MSVFSYARCSFKNFMCANVVVERNCLNQQSWDKLNSIYFNHINHSRSITVMCLLFSISTIFCSLVSLALGIRFYNHNHFVFSSVLVQYPNWIIVGRLITKNHTPILIHFWLAHSLNLLRMRIIYSIEKCCSLNFTTQPTFLHWRS